MRKRIKLRNRRLPDYSKGEEIMNMVTHIVGGGLSVVALVLCVIRAVLCGSWVDVVGAVVYGVCLIGLYTMSSVYHGLRPGMGKKVLQVLDHCTIYFLIAGSYTPVALSALLPHYPGLGLGLLIWEWGLTSLAVTLTAIDLKKYNVFSMICYIGMGWSILPSCPKPGRQWELAASRSCWPGALPTPLGQFSTVSAPKRSGSIRCFTCSFWREVFCISSRFSSTHFDDFKNGKIQPELYLAVLFILCLLTLFWRSALLRTLGAAAASVTVVVAAVLAILRHLLRVFSRSIGDRLRLWPGCLRRGL